MMPLEVLEQAIKTVTPVLEVRSRRVGGANYQIPIEVPARRARTLALRWTVTFARHRIERLLSEHPKVRSLLEALVGARARDTVGKILAQ